MCWKLIVTCMNNVNVVTVQWPQPYSRMHSAMTQIAGCVTMTCEMSILSERQLWGLG